jgi:hypothetical protein
MKPYYLIAETKFQNCETMPKKEGSGQNLKEKTEYLSNMNKKRTIIAGLIIASFILLLGSIIFFMNKLHEVKQLDPLELELMEKEQILQQIYERQTNTPFYYFIPIFSFFGIVVGALIYYILTGDLEKKDKAIKYNTGVILKLLQPDERKVITKIVENNGKIQQAEITYMEGFTKVKAHRVVESLAKKGIVSKESLGKMRLIKMHDEFYEVLKK